MVNSTDRSCHGVDFASRYSTWLGLLLVGCVFVVVTVLSWRKWPDILVDYGMQLYLPWRISEGDVLYRDVMYLTGGPLSQYFNALLFKLFGVSFSTLIFANLTITAGTVGAGVPPFSGGGGPADGNDDLHGDSAGVCVPTFRIDWQL